MKPNVNKTVSFNLSDIKCPHLIVLSDLSDIFSELYISELDFFFVTLKFKYFFIFKSKWTFVANVKKVVSVKYCGNTRGTEEYNEAVVGDAAALGFPVPSGCRRSRQRI